MLSDAPRFALGLFTGGFVENDELGIIVIVVLGVVFGETFAFFLGLYAIGIITALLTPLLNQKETKEADVNRLQKLISSTQKLE